METTLQPDQPRKVSTKLFFGILVLPYIFVWFLLRKGHPVLTRVLGFSWLLLMVYMFNTDRPATQSSDTPAAPVVSDNSTSPPATHINPPSMSIEYLAKINEVEKRLDSNRGDLKKYYASAHQVKQATEDSLLLASVRLAYAGQERSKEELAIRAKAEKLAPKVAEQGRELYASLMEETLVKTGMDAKISATAKDKKTLKIVYALMSQPLIYKFQNEAKIDEKAQQYGFTKIIYTNGFDGELGTVWTIDL